MKNKTLIKILCLILACLMLVPMIVACGDDEEGTTNTTKQNDVGTPEQVTITFALRGGSIRDGKAEVKIAKGAALKDSQIPVVEKTGYTFKYWAYDNAGQQEWFSDEKFTADTTLYAIWQENTGSNPGGTDNSNTPGSNNPGDNNPGGDDEGNVQNVTVTIVLRGGTVVSGSTTITVAKGSSIAESQMPTLSKDGYKLKCFAYDTAGTSEWFADDPINADTTLYAIWVADSTGGNEGDTPGTGDSGNTPGATDNITIKFATRGGTIIDGEAEITIKKGSTITLSQTPEVERSGYVFKYWAYDRDGKSEWFDDEEFDESLTLYAIWEEKSSGGNPGDGGDNPGGTDTPVVGNVTVEYNTGSGYFEDENAYEKVIKEGGRITSHPTPVNEKLSMRFDGWFKDSACTIPVSPSDKYMVNTTLYAKWTEMTTCLDGSYNHNWSAWDDDTAPTCTTAGTRVQVCLKCNAENITTGDPATGHKWRAWEEGFLKRQRFCSVAGCTGAQYQEFNNITFDVYSTVKLEGDCWGGDRAECIVDGNWDQGNAAVFAPKGTGAVVVTISLKSATMMDRIYVKGHGAGSGFTVSVQYEGESSFTPIGPGAFLTDTQNEDKENRVIPFVTPDATRGIVAVKIEMKTPSQGSDYWEEVAFVTIPPLEAE